MDTIVILKKVVWFLMHKQTIRKRKVKYRKSKQQAHIKKDRTGRYHCSACGAFVSKWNSLNLLEVIMSI